MKTNRCKNKKFTKTDDWNWTSSSVMVFTKDGAEFIDKGEIVEGQGNIPVYKEYVYECLECKAKHDGKPGICWEKI